MEQKITSGYELAKSYLHAEHYDLGKLMAYLQHNKNRESDWLEFKAACYPSREHVVQRAREWNIAEELAQQYEQDDCIWQVVRAAIGLANNTGGLIVIGVDEKNPGVPVPLTDPARPALEFADVKERLLAPALDNKKWKGIHDKARATTLLVHEALPGQALRTRIETGQLAGQPVCLVIVEPMPADHLFVVEKFKEGAQHKESLCYVRRGGDIGRVEPIDIRTQLIPWHEQRKSERAGGRYEAIMTAIRKMPVSQTEQAPLERFRAALPEAINQLARIEPGVPDSPEIVVGQLRKRLGALLPDAGAGLPDWLGNGASVAQLAEVAQRVYGPETALDDANRVLLFMHTLEVLRELQRELATKPGEAPAAATVTDGLPRRSQVFAARGDELERVLKLLRRENRSFYVTITGLGGIGKTTLALEAAHSCLELGRDAYELRFQRMFWLSAQDRLWGHEGKVSEITPQFATLDDVLGKLLKALDSRGGHGNLTTRQKGEQVHELLKRQRTLIILDNLETVRDPAVKQFFSNVPEPTKVLVTDRGFAIDGPVISLNPLAPEESEQMLREYILQHDPTLVLQDDEIRELAAATGGIPRVIDWIAHLICHRKHRVEHVVRHLRSNAQNLYGSLFDWSFAQLKPASQTLLQLTAALQRPASLDLLAELLGWSTDEVSDAAEDAVRLTLLRETHGHGVTPARARLIEMDEVTRRYSESMSVPAKDVAMKLVAYLVRQCGTDGWIDESHTHTVADLVEHIDWAFTLLERDHETQAMLDLVYSCAPSLGHLGFNERRLRYSRAAYEQIEHDPTRTLDQARLLVRQLGWVHFIAHEFDESLACYRRGEALAQAAGDVLTRAMAVKSIGQIHKERGDLAQARQGLHDAVFMLSEYGPTHEAAATLSALSSLERDCDDLDAAITHLNEAVAITAKLANADELNVVLKQKLARLLLSARKYDEAEAVNRDAERLNLAMRREAGVAYTRQLEALILEARGDLVGAWQKCREALGLFEAIGMKREIMKDYDRMRRAITPA